MSLGISYVVHFCISKLPLKLRAVIGRHSVLIASIDDLCGKALARAEGAVLTVTSTPLPRPSLLRHV